MDWLCRLFEMMPVRGRLDLRCSYGAPWRIDQGPGEANEIPYHAVIAGSAILEDPAGGRSLQLKAGDVLLPPGNSRHVMHDGSGARPKLARNRQELNLVISENAGRGERLDLLCGHLTIAPPARSASAELSSAALGRACRLSRRAERHRRAACRPCVPDAQRVGRRSSWRQCDAECIVDGDVRACAAARQRDRTRAARRTRKTRSKSVKASAANGAPRGV